MNKLEAATWGVVVLLFAGLPAHGADADHKNCTSDRGIQPEVRIEACSALIDTVAPGSTALAAALASRGQAQLDGGHLVEAMTDYTAAIDLYDRAGVHNLPELYESRAFLYQVQDRHGAAIADFDRALAADPNRAESYFGRGRSFARLNLATRAREDFDKALALKPGFAEAYVARGATGLFVSDIPGAIEDFEHATRIYPRLAAAYRNRGIAYDRSARYALAIADFDHAIALDPADREAAAGRHHAMAAAADVNQRKSGIPEIPPPEAGSRHAGAAAPSAMDVKRDRPPLAIGATHLCGGFYPEISRMLWEAGDMLVHYDVAVNGDIVNVAVSKPSGSPRLDRADYDCVSGGWRDLPALKDGQPVASLDRLAIVRFTVQGDRGDVIDYLRRGMGHAALGDYDAAMAGYSKAQKLDPREVTAYLNRGWIAYVQGKLADAEGDFAKAVRLNSSLQPALDALDLARAERAMPRPSNSP